MRSYGASKADTRTCLYGCCGNKAQKGERNPEHIRRIRKAFAHSARQEGKKEASQQESEE